MMCQSDIIYTCKIAIINLGVKIKRLAKVRLTKVFLNLALQFRFALPMVTTAKMTPILCVIKVNFS